jgi:hypothetical protein
VEIDESVMRAELTELERALSLKSRKRIYLALHPETAPVTPRRARPQKSDGPDRPPFWPCRPSRRQLGISARSIRRSIQIADGVIPKPPSGSAQRLSPTRART